jgi:nitroreductase
VSVSDAATRRRSIRQYDAGPIPRVDLEDIVRLAGLAPSAFNLQPWRFVIVESAGIKPKRAGRTIVRHWNAS